MHDEGRYHIKTSPLRFAKQIKSVDWFLYDNGLRHKRVNVIFIIWSLMLFLEIGNCTILMGEPKKILKCPDGTVATGSCGSGKSYDCGQTQHYRNMLHCCKHRLPNMYYQVCTGCVKKGASLKIR